MTNDVNDLIYLNRNPIAMIFSDCTRSECFLTNARYTRISALCITTTSTCITLYHIYLLFLAQNQMKLKAKGKISCMAESNNILVAGTIVHYASYGRVWNIETGIYYAPPPPPLQRRGGILLCTSWSVGTSVSP